MSAVSIATSREFPPAPAAIVAALALSDEEASDLRRYGQLLSAANASMNLVGAATLDDFWRRHVLDCGQLLKLAPRARAWADLGSGAGLPGAVLAILLKRRPGANVLLVESVAKRCRFLFQVIAELDLPAKVASARAESLDTTVDVVTARACAPLSRLLTYAEGFLRHGARGLFLKGEGAAAEIAIARKSWRFACETFGSLSDPRGQILSITGLSRVR
jgi:16S rRNA (guanine527-N7)-methyltransferase